MNKTRPKYRWHCPDGPAAEASSLAQQLGVSTLLAHCLANRGFIDAEPAARFLNPRLQNLQDPFLLPEMGAAVDRLWHARTRGERVAIFGDYDVDGVTSTALLLSVLSRLGLDVVWYLPHRLEEGYGLTAEAAANCLARHEPSLVLAVDCGTTSAATIAWLRERGVDTIVLDHHQAGPERPPTVALVNPAAHAATATQTSLTDLCSVGLAFKLAHALLKRGRQEDVGEARAIDLKHQLDLVALGTVADLVPLAGENRVLVSAGLREIETGRRPGLAALCQVAGLNGAIGPAEIAFQLGPRLNAAGRLEGAEAALKVLLTLDPTEGLALARTLNNLNQERQTMERAVADDVLRRITGRFDAGRDHAIVEGDATWHPGVVGIVASRLQREFYRPVVIVGGAGGEWRGSGRSVPGLDLAAALEACSDLLVRHGGHAMAAGLTLVPEQLDAFRARLNEVCGQRLAEADRVPSLRIDLGVSPNEITLDALEELRRLEPLGQTNPPVHLLLASVRVAGTVQRMGKEARHARFTVARAGFSHGVVWWNCDELPPAGATIDLVAEPQCNEYQGRRSVQLKLLDWRPAAQ